MVYAKMVAGGVLFCCRSGVVLSSEDDPELSLLGDSAVRRQSCMSSNATLFTEHAWKYLELLEEFT